jgi:hypothetical protein
MSSRTKKTEQSEDTSMEDAPPSAQPKVDDAMQEDEFAEDNENGNGEEEEEQVQRVRIVRLHRCCRGERTRTRKKNLIY